MFMLINNPIKKIAMDLLAYRKKQYWILKIIIFLLTLFETCITVIFYNESYVLSGGENSNVAIVGLFILLFIFWVTFYSIVYINFCIDKKNFSSLLRTGFTEIELVKSMKYFGRKISITYLFIGGIIGSGIGILSTWEYKQWNSILVASVMICITYWIIQIALKSSIKKILKPKNSLYKKTSKHKKNKLRIMNLKEISLKYMCYNWKHVASVCMLVFLSVFAISYSLSMIRSINVEKYILNTWGECNYKITLYKEGDMSGDYHLLQVNNPLTEELAQKIVEIEGVNVVEPNYSIKASINLDDEKKEVSISGVNEQIIEKANVNHLENNEIIISTRTVFLDEIKKIAERKVISVEYFDGIDKKKIDVNVIDIIVDDSKNTRIYANTQYIQEITNCSPVLSFCVYSEENDSIYNQISELIEGETLEMQDKNTYVSDAKKSLNVLVVGIVIVMVMLILFAISILINSKFLNIMVRKKDFEVLQTLGMTHIDIKKIMTIEEVICNIPILIFAWLLGVIMSYITCNGMGKIGSVFWVYNPAFDSLFWCLIFLVVISYIELRFYEKVMNKQ